MCTRHYHYIRPEVLELQRISSVVAAVIAATSSLHLHHCCSLLQVEITDADAFPQMSFQPQPSDFPLKPLGYTKFWDLLKRRQVDGQWQGIRLTHENKTHKCEMCSSHRRVQRELDGQQQLLDQLPANVDNTEISKKVRKLELMLERRVRHAAQLKHQRNWIKTNVTAELSLTSKTCMMQFDYVSFYNSNGSKVYNLVCVLHYRVDDDGSTLSSVHTCFHLCQLPSPHSYHGPVVLNACICLTLTCSR